MFNAYTVDSSDNRGRLAYTVLYSADGDKDKQRVAFTIGSWLYIIEGEVMAEPHGVVVTLFCLHEQAWQVCWFDSRVV